MDPHSSSSRLLRLQDARACEHQANRPQEKCESDGAWSRQGSFVSADPGRNCSRIYTCPDDKILETSEAWELLVAGGGPESTSIGRHSSTVLDQCEKAMELHREQALGRRPMLKAGSYTTTIRTAQGLREVAICGVPKSTSRGGCSIAFFYIDPLEALPALEHRGVVCWVQSEFAIRCGIEWKQYI
jgi:hypothetical protein